jgi:hypothetical protein
VSSDLDNLIVVGWVLSADVRLNRVADTETIKLGLSDLAPDLRGIDLVGVFLRTVNGNNLRKRISKMSKYGYSAKAEQTSPARLL